MAKPSSNNSLYHNHHNPSTRPCFLDDLFDIWWSKLLNKYIWPLPLEKPSNWLNMAMPILVYSWQLWLPCQLRSIQDPQETCRNAKERRQLCQPTTKRTIDHALFQQSFALVDCTVYLILLDAWQVHSNHNQNTIMIPPQWFPKNTTWEASTIDELVQWMWNSVFIYMVTMFLVCATNGIMYWLRNVFYGQRILFAIFIAAMALPKQVVLVPLVRIVSRIHDTLWANMPTCL